MIGGTAYLDWVWRWTKRSLYIVAVGAALIAVINFWDAAASGRPLPWGIFDFAVLLVCWAALILRISLVIYKVLRRRAEHYERRK